MVGEKAFVQLRMRIRQTKMRQGQKNVRKENKRARSCWSGVINHSSVDFDLVEYQALKVYFTQKCSHWAIFRVSERESCLYSELGYAHTLKTTRCDY